MKRLLLILSAFLPLASFSQILNGSFENGGIGDLSHWESVCGMDTFHDAAPGGGNSCIKVTGSNPQGCFPGYAYQKLPSVTNGQTFLLTGWAHADGFPPAVLYFGAINNGVITTQAGDTTVSTSWTQLSVQSSFTLSPGDTACVILYGGFAGGPAQGYGYFDLIELQEIVGVADSKPKSSLSVFPNPFAEETRVQAETIFQDASLTVYNSVGQPVKQQQHISGADLTLHRDNLPGGLYFLEVTEAGKVTGRAKIVVGE